MAEAIIVNTPTGQWKSGRDFIPDGTIKDLIDFIADEMEINKGDLLEIVHNEQVLPPETPVWRICDCEVELVATGRAV